jgi:hypothetical protein
VRQFVVGPAPDKKVVNLKEVSNIGFEYYKDRNNRDAWKIIYNFSYPVSLRGNNDKLIPDYLYHVYYDKSEYDRTVDILNDLINEQLWLAPSIDGIVKRLINPNKISFIAKDERKNRIIVNLSTTTSFYNDFHKKTSDFLYLDFKTHEEFQAEYNYMMEQINLKTM